MSSRGYGVNDVIGLSKGFWVRNFLIKTCLTEASGLRLQKQWSCERLAPSLQIAFFYLLKTVHYFYLLILQDVFGTE